MTLFWRKDCGLSTRHAGGGSYPRLMPDSGARTWGYHESDQVLGLLRLENRQNFLFRDEELSGQVSIQKLGVKLQLQKPGIDQGVFGHPNCLELHIGWQSVGMFLFQDVSHTCFVNPRFPNDYEGFRFVSFSSHAPDCSIAGLSQTLV